MRTPPAHHVTTAHLQAAYPFVAGVGGWSRDGRPGGPLLGRDLLGAAFCFDPWDRYASGEITGPNIVVIGQIGRGKSTFVKTLLWREIAFGRRAWVIDPKGEYGPLAAACGTVPLRLEPGGELRLNPLEPQAPDTAQRGRGGEAETGGGGDHRRGAELLASVAAASLGRDLQPGERTAIDLAVRTSMRRADAVCARAGTTTSVGRAATVPDVVAALLQPEVEAAAEVHTDPAGLAADGRQVALELRRLTDGDLSGMFDGPTSAGVDLDAPIVVLDLSALYRSAALGIVMICATAWLHAAMTAGDGQKRLVVLDEAWAVLHDLATARWLQASFKLSRSLGAAHVAVLHRLSDLQAAGGAGSQQRQLAEGLLADAETRVVFAQPASESRAAAQLLGLTSAEEEILPQLPRAVALWKIGGQSALVRHILAPGERPLVDTDAAMVDEPLRFPGSDAEITGTGG